MSEGRVGEWSEVGVGDVVRLKGMAEWTVTAKEGLQVTVETPGREPYTGVPTGPVFIVSQARDLEMAEALVAVRLGGEAVARQDSQGRWTTPVDYPDVGSLLAHLYLFHGETFDSDSLAEVEAEHGRLHDSLDKAPLHEPHVHTPDFNTVRIRE